MNQHDINASASSHDDESIEIEIYDADGTDNDEDEDEEDENYEEEEYYDDIEQQAKRTNSRKGHHRPILPEVQAIPELSKSLSVVTEMTDVTPLMDDEDKDDKDDEEDYCRRQDMEFDTVHAQPSSSPPPMGDNARIILHRPARISFSIHKESHQTRLGIFFQSTRQGTLVVSNIRSDGLLVLGSLGASCDEACGGIRPGDYLLTINNLYCARWSPSQAAQQLRTLTGMVTLVVAASAATNDGKAPRNRKEKEKKKKKNDHVVLRTTKNIVDPHLIQVTVVKNNSSTPQKWGLSLVSEHGRLRVKILAANGLLGDSALRAGDYILSINGIPCLEAGHNVACDLLRKMHDVVTILAISPTACTTTTTGGARPLSSLLYKLPPTTRVISTRHVLMGLASSSRRINSLSNQPPPPGPKHRPSACENAILAMAKAVSFRRGSFATSSSTWDQQNDDIVPKYYSAMMIKPTSDAKLGIHFKLDDQGRIFISHIVPGSIVATSTSLRTGLILISINNKPVQFHPSKKSMMMIEPVQYANQLVQEAQGELVMVAQDPSPEAGASLYLHASATKFDPRAPLGIGFVSFHGSLHIKTIHPSGVFAASLLTRNDTVVLINQVPCRHWTCTEAVEHARDPTQDIISIVVRSSPSSGAVVSEWDKEANGSGDGDDDDDGDPDAVPFLQDVADGLPTATTTTTTTNPSTTPEQQQQQAEVLERSKKGGEEEAVCSLLLLFILVGIFYALST